MSSRFLLAVAVASICSGCGGGSDAVATSSAPAAASASAPAVKPTAVAVSDMVSENEHVCLEYDDEELATEYARALGDKLVRGGVCPTKDRLGACRLPDGSARYSYPPKSASQAEKACKESRGKFAAGEVAPAADPVVLIACDGKLEGACEEESVFTAARIKPAEEECAAYGSKLEKSALCSRENLVATCDLEGRRTIFFKRAPVANAVRQRYCEERHGRFELTAPSASASADAAADPSAAPVVDDDQREPKADVVVRPE